MPMKKSILFAVIFAFLSSGVASAQCPPAVSFATPGIFHIPTVATPVKRLTYQPPAGNYNKIHLSMDVKVGQWDAANPQNNHLIFWLVRDAKNFDMFGYVGLFGPGKNELMLRHGWQNVHADKAKVTESTKLFAPTFTPGTTYTFDYIYDASNRFIQLVVIDKSNGQQRMRLTHFPNTSSFSFSATEDVTIDMGFDPALNPNEVATYGWEYSNIKVDLYDDIPPVITSSSVVKATCPACPDGQAQVSVTGGTLPYTYAWSPSSNTTSAAIGILPGGYTVTVSDSKGCIDRKNIAVGLLPVPGVVEPVKISDKDPHWVEYKGKTTYLAGFTHSLANLAQQNTYHKTYIDWLSANNLNTFRNIPFMGQEYYDVQMKQMLSPYKRTGPGLANDGKPKYDLTKYEAAFFTYWKNLLNYAQSKDVIMFFNIFDSWHLRQWDKNQCNGNSTGSTSEWCHTYDAYYGANNINGVNAANITQYHDNAHPVNAWQKQFINKVVDELGGYPNLIWEVCNENFQNRDWEAKLAEYLTNYELSKGMTPHLVLTRDIPNHEQTPGGRQTMALEEINSALAGMHGNPVPHVFHNDGTNQGNAVLMRNLAWASLTAGSNSNIFSVTSWVVYDSVEMASQDYQDKMKYVGFTRKFLNDFNVDLRGMKPDTTLATNNFLKIWALGRIGEEYVLYYKAGGNSNIAGLPANYNAYWFNPRTGASQTATPTGGNKFTTPDNNDWVLYIRKPKNTDVQPWEITSPLANNCKDTADVSVLIKNNGTLDLYSVKLNYKLDNNPVVTTTQNLSPWVKVNDTRRIFLVNELKNLSPGNHTIKIWTSSPNDGADTNVGNDTITRLFSVTSTGKPLMFSEDFESGMPADWSTFNPDGGQNWFVFGGAGYNSSKSAAVNNHAYTGAYFEADYLALPEVDLTTGQVPQLSFWYSHASKPVSYRYDSLEVLISTDCARTFQSIWSAGGNALNTGAANAGLFVPSSPGDWTNATVDLSPYKASTKAIIIFRNWSNNNNSLLIDKINITDVTAVEDANEAIAVSVFPNPASGMVAVNARLSLNAQVSIRLMNILGENVYSDQVILNADGNFSCRMDVSKFAAGVYQMVISAPGQMIQKKIIVK